MTQFVANGPAENHPANPLYETPRDSAPSESQATGKSPSGQDTGGNPYSRPLDHGPTIGAASPYAPTHQVVVSPGPFSIRQVGFDEIWSPAWEITKERFGIIIGAIAIMLVASVAVIILAQVVTVIVGLILATINPDIAGVAGLLVMPLSFLARFYFTVGLAGVGIAIARNEPSPLSRLVAPIAGVGKFLGVVLGLFLAAGIPVGILLAIGGIANQGGGNEVVAIFGIIVILALIVGGFAVGIAIWPLKFLCAENRSTFSENISICRQILQLNFLTSILVLLASAGLMILGYIMCFVGLIFTVPLITMLMSVGYLLMTGQPVSVPQRFVPQAPIA